MAVLGVGAAAVAVGTTASADSHGGLSPLGVFDSGSGEAGSEIVAVDTSTGRMFVTNGAENRVDIIDISDPDNPAFVDAVDVDGGLQSVAVGDGLVAAAVAGPTRLSNGTVVTFDADGNAVADYQVGVLPDSIAFTDDGRYIVVANEAEPVCDDDELLGDPEGSISVIDTRHGAVRTAGFTRWDGKEDALREQGVRIFFPGSSASQDLEPEYVSIEGNTAYVTLQEANAVAVVNIKAAKVTRIIPLGYQDHSVEGAGLDPSNRDDAEAIAPWDVLGMYMPDAIALTELGGEKYFVTANEGDSRDYDCYSEEIRVKDLADPDEGVVIDGVLAPGLSDAYSADDIEDERLGRLKTTTAFPAEVAPSGGVAQVYSYGARSFTIWNPAGKVVFDSGDDFGQILTGTPFFNLDENETDGRSDDKGAEPEALAVGEVDGSTYAFIGLERSGGVMMYDITDPANATFVDYVNTAEVANDEVTGGGDVGPEGIAFIPAADSPTGEAMIAVSFEISGTTRLFQVG